MLYLYYHLQLLNCNCDFGGQNFQCPVLPDQHFPGAQFAGARYSGAQFAHNRHVQYPNRMNTFMVNHHESLNTINFELKI